MSDLAFDSTAMATILGAMVMLYQLVIDARERAADRCQLAEDLAKLGERVAKLEGKP